MVEDQTVTPDSPPPVTSDRNLKFWYKTFLSLSKSGIVALILISVFGGYLLGHRFDHPMNWGRLALTLLGLLFLASGSSALNQLQEISIDQAMPRTRLRPLASGSLSKTQGLAFVVLTSATGLALLYSLSLSLMLLGLLALFSYNVLYTMWVKPRWAFAAVPGAIPGALPIAMGYIAASDRVFSPGALYVFSLLFFWQMPHFWVLALKYREDYLAGNIPTLPVKLGQHPTVFQISLWTLAYVGISMIAPFFIGVGSGYILSAGVISALLLSWLVAYSRAPNAPRAWLRFFLGVNFSLILYLGAAILDLWSVYLIPYFTQ
jgi:protoheme IX farnesyltransferase